MKQSFLFLLTGFTLLACEKNKESQNFLPPDNTFNFALNTEPPTLDWSKATDTTSNAIIDNIMDGLTDYDFSVKNKVGYQLALAQKIEAQNKAKTWLITLREDVYWTDGIPLQPQHVIDGWERVLNPETASQYAFILHDIKNARAYTQGTLKDFSKVGVKLTKDRKIKVDLNNSKHFFPHVLTHSTTFPIRKDIIKKHGAKWIRPENIVTLGPYTLEKWEHDKLVVLKKNKSYYGTFPGNAENVSIKIIQEPTTALNLFDVGKLDVTIPPSEQMDVLRKRPEYVSAGTLTTEYYGFKTTHPPLDNVKVRKAIVMAIDKRQLVKLIQEVSPINSWIPKGLFGHNAEIGLKFNPKKAKELLDSSGVKIPKMSISYSSSPRAKRIAENIQAQLKKHLSLDIELKSEEWKTYLASIKSPTVFIFRMGWRPDYYDPHTFMEFMASSSEQNHTKWTNKEFDKLIEKTSKLPNSQKRQALYDKMQKLFIEDAAPVVPLFQYKQTLLIAPRVKHYPINMMTQYRFKEVILQ